MLAVTFLGTSAARPTVERNVSALALVREGETLLFECGEGTQRQMLRYGVSFALSEIFFTHFHADHFLGVIGLIRTLGLQGREEPLRLYGPKGGKHVRSEEHTSELQSLTNLVCRLLLEKKKKNYDAGNHVQKATSNERLEHYIGQDQR